MTRIFNKFLVATLIVLAGCTASDNTPPVSQASSDAAVSDWRENRFQQAHVIFEADCANCHGAEGTSAPRIGDRDSWSDRSPLWSAVLFEHAKNGYLDMPAKGGDPSLSESDVEAAGEYMLSETFPDLPRD